MIFAQMVIERPPLEWVDLLGAVGQWLQDAGLYAFVWLLILLLAYLVVPEFRQRAPWSWLHQAMMFLAVGAIALFVAYWILLGTQGQITDLKAPRSSDPQQANAPERKINTPQQRLCLALAGLLTLTACAMPILRDISQRRVILRRVWAIARLSIKEAWSRGIVWVCVIIPLIYLYADWYISTKPEDQLRNRVGIAYFSMTVLFMLTAALLGAFSIPADIRNQNIFTIVTKPVERFEIVLGRFLGYAVLLLAEVVVLTGISYFYVARGLTDQAIEESYHARVPLYGAELYFHNTAKRSEGDNVGREWNYRSYITGVNPQAQSQRVQYAIWAFDEVPASLANRDEKDDVRLEFHFDIFRTTTGQQNKDVYCTFTFAKGNLSPDQVEELLKATGKINTEYNKRYGEALKRNAAKGARGPELDELNAASKREIAEKLFEEEGVYSLQGVGVTDYHTQWLQISPRIFKTLVASAADRKPGADGSMPPAMQIYINVENDPSSRLQMVGVAKPDLYLLVSDRPFWINFFKGSLCIFLISCIVLGVAVVCSTYFSGIVSLLATALLCVGGLFLPFIRSIAEGRAEGGGPLEAVYRLANRQVSAVPLDQQSATIAGLLRFDAVYRWWLQRITNLIPEISLYYRSDYVSNGFDITWGVLLFLNTILPIAGFLIPWAMLAYYLIKSREIANP